MGAPLGNQNGRSRGLWSAAIQRALERRKPADERVAAIDELADKLLDQCSAGSLPALQELGNRLDGKAAQSVMLAGDPENPLTLIERVLVRANAKD